MAKRKNAPRKRTYRRKAKKAYKKRSNTLVNRSSNMPISPNYVTKMKFHQRFVITNSGTVNTAVQNGFYLNGIHQPNISGATHQPFGHDQMSALYTKNRVFACSWRLEIQPSTTNGTVTVLTNPISGESYAGADLGYIGELPNAVTKTVKSDTSVVFTGKRSLPRYVGLTSAQYKGNEDYDASYGALPSITPQLFIISQSDTASSTYIAHITLMYHVESFAPKVISQS